MKEIIDNNGNSDYFDKYFDSSFDNEKTKYKTEKTLRSAFGGLKQAGLINAQWTDNITWALSVTSKDLPI